MSLLNERKRAAAYLDSSALTLSAQRPGQASPNPNCSSTGSFVELSVEKLGPLRIFWPKNETRYVVKFIDDAVVTLLNLGPSIQTRKGRTQLTECGALDQSQKATHLILSSISN